jgi:predicted nucleotidyltransferase component of viral defense system
MNFPHDDLQRFRESVRVTQNLERFLPRLIEKDYFCTLVLGYLAAEAPRLVFKGGTCLAKVHAGFYRLSEDLDFTIPMSCSAKRSERKNEAQGLRRAMDMLAERVPFLRYDSPLTGANNSTQYNAVIGYTSLLSGDNDIIKIEVALREPLIEPAERYPARTLLIDPVSREPLMEPVPLVCISFVESFAEKIRAALTRRESAIRDFYDIDYAVRRLGLHIDNASLLAMVKQKLAVPGTPEPDVSDLRFEQLGNQVHTQLKPVLRLADFEEFDLARAIGIVRSVAAVLREKI